MSRCRGLFHWIQLLPALLVILSSSSNAIAAPKLELDLTINELSSTEPLTTSKVAELDPAQPNPELRRWVVGRGMEIMGWKSRKLHGGLVGVQGGVLQGSTTIYLRPAGPWYDQLSQFPCNEKAPDPVFATEAGTRASAHEAVKLWDELLSEGKFKLSILLSKVAAVNEKSAWTKADRIFQEWLVGLDHEWRAKLASEVAVHQWAEYRKDARLAGYCKEDAKTATHAGPPASPESWMARSEVSVPPHPEEALSVEEKPLARAPSRRWNGLFAVRMDMGVGDNSALGQVLIDPATPRSVISPDWLTSQGVRPEWLEIPEASPLPVKVIAGSGQKGLGPVARSGYAKISGYNLSLGRFLLFDTLIFDQPESAGPCCSGVLGIDFLRRYVVEFAPQKPTAVQLWNLVTYHPPQDYHWVEVRDDGEGRLTPVCSDRVKAEAKEISHKYAASSHELVQRGVQSNTRANPEIGGKTVTGVDPLKKLCQDPRHALLEATGTVIFDLPHDRIWYSNEELTAPTYQNTSGVQLSYTFLKGDRVLVVKTLGKTSEALNLSKAGLKPGAVITEIDGLPANEMDLWEVDRRLSGVYGQTVTLKWKTAQGFKSEPLRVFSNVLKTARK